MNITECNELLAALARSVTASDLPEERKKIVFGVIEGIMAESQSGLTQQTISDAIPTLVGTMRVDARIKDVLLALTRVWTGNASESDTNSGMHAAVQLLKPVLVAAENMTGEMKSALYAQIPPLVRGAPVGEGTKEALMFAIGCFLLSKGEDRLPPDLRMDRQIIRVVFFLLISCSSVIGMLIDPSSLLSIMPLFC